MTKDTEIGYRVTATIKGMQGECSAGHKTGETFEISCYNTGGLCGYCYHKIFPDLQTFQFGGNLPWWQGLDVIETRCPDPRVQLLLELKRETY